MAAFALLAAALGAQALGGWQQYQQGQYQSQLGVATSEQLEQQAREEQQQAAAGIAQQDVKAAETLGAQVSRTATSGITEEGTPSFLMHTSEEEAMLNDMYATYSANLKANDAYFQGMLAKTQGQDAAQAATVGAITGTTLGGVSAGMDYYGLKYGKYGSGSSLYGSSGLGPGASSSSFWGKP